MRPVNPRRVFTVVSVLALMILYTILWTRTLVDPKLRTGSDYIAFYAAGRIAHSMGFNKIYELPLQKVEEEKEVGFEILSNDVNPFVHPPFIVPLLAVLANFDYVPSYHLWALFLLMTFAACAWMFLAYFPELPVVERRWLFVGLMLFYPSFISVLNGQDSAILLLGAVGWFLGFIRKDDRLSGLGLALTVIRPHIALLLAIPFFFKRQRTWWWFCSGATVLVVVSIVLIGFDGVVSYLKILTVSASGEGYKINEVNMVNLIGVLRRMFPSMLPQTTRVVGWVVYVVAVLGVAMKWVKSREIHEIDLGTSVLIGILSAPHLHYHDLVLFVIPLFITIRILLEKINLEIQDIKTIVFSFTWILIFSSLFTLMKYSITYVFAVLMMILFWRPEIFRSTLSRRNKEQFQR